MKMPPQDSLSMPASSAPNHQDCARRWAAHSLPGFIESFGLEKIQQIGALIGDCCHLGSAYMLCQKAEADQWSLDEAVELAYKKLDEAFKKKVKTDDITDGKGTAKIQIRSMLGEFSRSLMPTVRPRHVELSLIYQYSEYTKVPCQIDLIEEEGHIATIHDHKFGSHCGPYFSQFGLYKCGLEQQKWFKGEVGKLLLNFIERPRVKKSGWKQADLVQLELDLDACVRAGLKQVEEAERETKLFRETGDLWSFNPNPNSKYCDQRLCRAWGSGACDQWIDMKGVLESEQ